MTLAKVGVAALLAGGLAAVALVGFAGPERADAASEPAKVVAGLKPVSAFTDIKARDQRAVALFEEAGKVLQSPRCMNCHPAGDRPTQTDRMIPHQPLVVRGEAGMGAPGGLACTTCHHEANFDAARVPGNPKWQLARSRWPGRAGRSARSARRSRIPSSTAARAWPSWFIIWRRTSWSAGAGIRGVGGHRRRGRRSSSAS